MLALIAALQLGIDPALNRADLKLIGAYVCTVKQKASIASRHMAGSGEPKAAIDSDLPKRFSINIKSHNIPFIGLQVDETPYAGSDRDRVEYHTENSVLHSSYSGAGPEFSANQDQGRFWLGKAATSDSDGDYEFYHSGFEYPGGEDTKLSIRWGYCKRQ